MPCCRRLAEVLLAESWVSSCQPLVVRGHEGWHHSFAFFQARYGSCIGVTMPSCLRHRRRVDRHMTSHELPGLRQAQVCFSPAGVSPPGERLNKTRLANLTQRLYGGATVRTMRQQTVHTTYTTCQRRCRKRFGNYC